MNTFDEQLKAAAAHLRLSAKEKQRMRVQLTAHMQAHPLRGTPSPWVFWVRAARFGMVPLVVLLLCAGTAYAAEGSLPGDLLYPIKIHVNEPVEVALAPTPQAQAEVEIQLAARRVAEAQALAAQGRLDATTTQELENNFNSHATEAIALAQTLLQKAPIATTSVSAIASSTAASAATSTTPQMERQIASSTTAARAPTRQEILTGLRSSLSAEAGILEVLKLRLQLAQASSTPPASAESATSTLDVRDRMKDAPRQSLEKGSTTAASSSYTGRLQEIFR